jgi:hypothetical protein
VLIPSTIHQPFVFCALYSDRGSHFWLTPKVGSKVDRHRLTQVGRALHDLGVQMIPAYSPQARGRSERNFSTWQGRLPPELRLHKITNVEDANGFLREHYIAQFNRRTALSGTVHEGRHGIGDDGNAGATGCGKDASWKSGSVLRLRCWSLQSQKRIVQLVDAFLPFIVQLQFLLTHAGINGQPHCFGLLVFEAFQFFGKTLDVWRGRFGGHGTFERMSDVLQRSTTGKPRKPIALFASGMNSAAAIP